MQLSDVTIQNVILCALLMFLIAIVWLLAEFNGMKEQIRARFGLNNETLKLQLQAYERLAMYAERAGIKNLVARTPYTDRTVVDLQLELGDALKSEYEYNVSQQIYVTPEIWKAIGNLRDQHVYIINQLAATLPPQAPAIELSKRLLEYVAAGNNGLNNIVLDALQFETKKLL